MHIVSTIIPIFVIITLGWIARWKGFIQAEFLGPANRLVYYMAIPAMIFRSISRSSLTARFHIQVIAVTLGCIFVVFAIAWSVAMAARIKKGRLGSFTQCSFHGNLGYIGLAVAYYYLGNEGLVRAGILAGFIMILQNFLAVVILQVHADHAEGRWNKAEMALRILGNPVILSAIGGILFSLSGAEMPVLIGRSLDILSGLALPMALLIIGASLSFQLVRSRIIPVLFSGLMKLVLLPGLAFLSYRAFGLANPDYLPGIILLASPTATITYVMAKEMHGDSEFAVAAISASTLLSAVTFSLWLHIAG
jgi:predicted permease